MKKYFRFSTIFPNQRHICNHVNSFFFFFFFFTDDQMFLIPLKLKMLFGSPQLLDPNTYYHMKLWFVIGSHTKKSSQRDKRGCMHACLEAEAECRCVLVAFHYK